MPHAFTFRAQVVDVAVIRCDLDARATGDNRTVTTQGFYLLRIIRQDFGGGDTQVGDDLAGDGVLAGVDRQSLL